MEINFVISKPHAADSICLEFYFLTTEDTEGTEVIATICF